MKQQGIPVWRKICYALGDFAQNGTFQFVAYYLLYFYTDEAKCSLAVINVVLVLGRVVDALATPLVGVMVDRSHFKMGKCRPWVLLGSLCLNVALPLLFFVPAVDEKSVRIWLILIYSLFSVSYALANVPYSVMMSVMTQDEGERYSLNKFKNIGANLSGVLLSVCTLSLVSWFSERGHSGYLGAALVYAAVFLCCCLLCVAFTREQKPEIAGNSGQSERITWKMMARAFGNVPWKLFLCIQLLACVSNMLHTQSMMYYAKYCIGTETVSTWFMMAGPASAVLAAFYLPRIAQKIGMKNSIVLGVGISTAALLGIRFADGNIVGSVIMQFLYSIGWATATGLIFVIITAIIDYQEFQTGERPQGFMISSMTFMMKCGSMLGVMAGTWILDRAGYRGDMEATKPVLDAIRVEFIWLPGLMFVLILILLAFFRIDHLCDEKED